MSLRIDSDVHRFKDKIKNRVKEDLGKFIGSEQIVGRVGGKNVKIPLPYINIPHFTFGGRNGGVGSGDGEIGDDVGNGKGKNGRGKKGGEEGDDRGFEAEFTIEELANMLQEVLQLPDLEVKSKGEIKTQKTKYTEIAPVGIESLRHFRRSYKEALKREISTGNYDPDNPNVIPYKRDMRYRSFTTEQIPETSAVHIIMRDCSGSMLPDHHNRLARIQMWWIDVLLRKYYPNLKTEYIVHSTNAELVSGESDQERRDKFYKISSGGGTKISSAWKMAADLIEERYPYSAYNVFLSYIGDSENGESAETPMNILTEKLLNNCDHFGYTNVKDEGGSGDFLEVVRKFSHPKLKTSEIGSNEDILQSIKQLFSK